MWDHLQWSGEDDGEPRQPSVDPTVALTMIAAATSRVRLGPDGDAAGSAPAVEGRPRADAPSTTSRAVDSRWASGWAARQGLEFGDFGEETDARVRAAKLDEGLDVLAGLWTGQPFELRRDAPPRHAGPRCCRRPVQYRRAHLGGRRVAGASGARSGGPPASTACTRCCSPFRRTSSRRRSADLVRYIRQFRAEEEPFDVAFGAETAGDGGSGRPRPGSPVRRRGRHLVDGAHLALARSAGRDAGADPSRSARMIAAA